METTKATTITVQADVNAPIEKVWKYWTEPQHITQWCAASDDWHAPYAENDVRKDGKFKTTMAAKDGSVSFDFEGVYTRVDPNKRIDYAMSDGRTVSLIFSGNGNSTHISETFDPENTHSLEQQREGWQAILNNFKAYTERT
ncbi:MAG TPA: SRPBCC family protein [Chryseosolibacter sp.]|nr:SRPBCC family protein [Chryseosolibacter sp.]